MNPRQTGTAGTEEEGKNVLSALEEKRLRRICYRQAIENNYFLL
jgi:hypothetical protein